VVLLGHPHTGSCINRTRFHAESAFAAPGRRGRSQHLGGPHKDAWWCMREARPGKHSHERGSTTYTAPPVPAKQPGNGDGQVGATPSFPGDSGGAARCARRTAFTSPKSPKVASKPVAHVRDVGGELPLAAAGPPLRRRSPQKAPEGPSQGRHFAGFYKRRRIQVNSKRQAERWGRLQKEAAGDRWRASTPTA
jgi:hypothetical protein